MKDKRAIIKIKNCNVYEVIKVFSKYNIFYENLNYNKGNIFVEISLKDYNKIKYSFKRNVKIYKKTGLSGIVEFIKKHYIFIISFVFSYFIILYISNFCFGINIQTNNSNLKNIILYDLEKTE